MTNYILNKAHSNIYHAKLHWSTFPLNIQTLNNLSNHRMEMALIVDVELALLLIILMCVNLLYNFL